MRHIVDWVMPVSMLARFAMVSNRDRACFRFAAARWASLRCLSNIRLVNPATSGSVCVWCIAWNSVCHERLTARCVAGYGSVDGLHLNSRACVRRHRHTGGDFPGQGELTIEAFMQALSKTVYDCPLSHEIFNDIFRRSDPVQAAQDGNLSSRYLESIEARRGTATDRWWRWVCRSRIPTPVHSARAFCRYRWSPRISLHPLH